MAKKKLTDEQMKEIELLKANNEMLRKTRNEIAERGGSDTAIRQVDEAIQEVIENISKIDKDAGKKMRSDISRNSISEKKDTSASIDAEIFTMLQEQRNVGVPAEDKKKKEPSDVAIPSETIDMDDSMYNKFDPTLQYDVIPLPSKGQGYRSKIDRVPVGYLTAYDENFITSPNLYRDGLVIDFLLKNKILNDSIDVDDLLSGDADAIVLFLRATSYGIEFPIVVRDPDTGEQIESTVDLSKLKPKEFKLIGDENGWFDYETEYRHDKIKFRYLTRKQEKALKRLTELEGYGTRAAMLENASKDIQNAVLSDDICTSQEKDEIKKVAKTLDGIIARLREKDSSAYNKIITNNLVMQVMSVNGNTDREYIRNYVNSMPARESLLMRRFINTNAPGIDFEIEVQRPESLGGGSFKTFLNWDDSVFLNIPDV